MNGDNSNGNSQTKSLEEIIQLLGITKKEFAIRIGASRRAVVRWSQGEREISLKLSQVKALRRELQKIGLDIDDLPDYSKEATN